MIDHGIVLTGGNCRLRPITAADENNVLTLWNQDWCIGTLWSSTTTRETYRKYFNAYAIDEKTWEWVIEDLDGGFSGTIGCKLVGQHCETGWFALYPTKKFLAITPCFLMNEFIFFSMKIDEIKFTINPMNEKIRKLHTVLGAEFTGERDTVVSKYGVVANREHWHYTRDSWMANHDSNLIVCS